MHLIVLVDTWQEQLAGTPVTFLLFEMFIMPDYILYQEDEAVHS